MIKILALDFDGVVCNGLKEYFLTSKKAYNQIWNQEKIENQDLQQSFYKLRPVIETGWEMPVLLRALVLNFPETEIMENWQEICQRIIKSEQVNPQKLADEVDAIRENWIKTDLNSWLELHAFYEGVVDKLKQILVSDFQIYIITTKESKFVKQLLKDQGLSISDKMIFGKEQKRPKYEILRQIIEENKIEPDQVFFVEDRLPALELVNQQADLKNVNLFLASWGYNTEKIRNSLEKNKDIQLLLLEEFVTNFP